MQVRIHGEPIHLSRSEWLLVKALADHKGPPRLYHELLTEVWVRSTAITWSSCV